MAAEDTRNECETVVVRRQEQSRREGREMDALRSSNTRSCSRVPQTARPVLPPSARRHRPRARLGLSSTASTTMDVTFNPSRMSWGPGLLSPLSPNTIESLESRSRDVQERTFCKWYPCPYADSEYLQLTLFPQAEY